MLIFRYLAKELSVTLTALTTIMLLIFMSNQFVAYLNRAANGKIPAMIVLKLMMLELPTLLVMLLPLGFYAALLVAYGRLYADSEMTVLQACGYGPGQLLKHTFILASLISVFLLVIMLWGSPLIMMERAKLFGETGVQTLIKTIVPSHFRAVSGGSQVFYVGSMSTDHTVAKNVFLARLVKKDNHRQWDVLWAEKAFAETELGSNEDYVVLQDGKQYQGQPGRADYQVAEFERYKARLPHPTVIISNDIRAVKVADLWPLNNPDIHKAAEFQWRLSIPFMAMTLALVGVPLSRVNPRAGKYAKLLPAMFIYIFYANGLFIARDWFAEGKTPVWLGMWWPHVIIILLGLLLLRHNQKKPA